MIVITRDSKEDIEMRGLENIDTDMKQLECMTKESRVEE